jgi:RHS repeat-associated protein
MSPGIIAESDLSGNSKSEYVFFAGERIARKDFPGNAVSYYFSDHLKTASVITNSAGTITEDEDYYPWGGELQMVNNDSNHYKFTGKERDSETGLDYFGARYYGNGLGRWVSPDWATHAVAVPYANFGNPQSLNLYTYTKNNPTTLGDPDGHQSVAQQVFCVPCVHSQVAVAKDVATRGFKAAAKDAGMGALGVLADTIGFIESDHSLKGRPAPPTNVPNTPSGHVGAVVTTVVVFMVPTTVSVSGTAATVETETVGLADSALVVRGGVPTAAQLTKGAESISTDGTLQGISVQSANGATVEQLSQGLPHNQVGVTTVGDVRAAGGDVVPTPEPGNPCHCDMNGVTPEQGSKLFDVQPNPSKAKTPN